MIGETGVIPVQCRYGKSASLVEQVRIPFISAFPSRILPIKVGTQNSALSLGRIFSLCIKIKK